MSSRESKEGDRVIFIDLMRVVATVQMVQGHTIDALLDPLYRQGAVHGAWTWARGLTAVMFLLTAGLSYHLSTLTRFRNHRADPRAYRRRLRRALLLIGLGYAMHAPVWLLGGATASGGLNTGSAGAAILAGLLAVDVLQCIGIGIGVLEIMTLVLPSPRHVAAAALVLGLGVWAAVPLVDGVVVAGPWAPLLTYLNNSGGAVFPLAPWLGYLLVGVAVGHWVVPSGRVVRPRDVTVRLLSLGVGFLLLSLLLPHEDLGDIAERAGCVLLLAAALALAEGRGLRMPRPLAMVGRETLVIYLGHVVVLYASGVGVGALVGRTLTPLAATAAALGMLVLSYGIAALWDRLKTHRDDPSRLAGGPRSR